MYLYISCAYLRYITYFDYIIIIIARPHQCHLDKCKVRIPLVVGIQQRTQFYSWFEIIYTIMR